MAALFHPQQSQLSFELGEYQHAQDASTGETRTPRCVRVPVLLLSFGLLCVFQAVLNVSLRLSARNAAAAGAAGEPCPPGWRTFACSCYYISSQGKNWDDSREDCTSRDADLVIINSRREQAFLADLVEAAWVGMTDRQREGRWLWVDGTEVSRGRLDWAPGQPDGAFGGEDCGDLRNMPDFMGLNDFNCSARAPWICERPRCS